MSDYAARLRPVALADDYAVVAFQRQAACTRYGRVHVVVARRCKIYVRAARGERNSAARIFRSSCSRSLEIASGHYGRLLANPPPGAPYRAPLCPLSPSFSFFPSPSPFLTAAFFPFVPLPAIVGPFSRSRLCRFLSVLSRLLYPLLRDQTRGPRWYAAQWRRRRRVVPR